MGRRLSWAAAAVVLAGLASVGAWRLDQARTDAARRAELTALRTETTQLADQLKQLREQEKASSPVLYLGGDDQIDLVFDLRRVAGRGRTAQPRPASYTPPGR